MCVGIGRIESVMNNLNTILIFFFFCKRLKYGKRVREVFGKIELFSVLFSDCFVFGGLM